MVKLDKIPINTYFFTIFDNPVNGKRFLIFRGVGCVDKKKKKAVFNDEKFWGRTGFGYLYARNYYDMLKIYKEMPCVLINTSNKVVSFDEYSCQKEIQEKFDITVSELYSRPHNSKDTFENKSYFKKATNDVDSLVDEDIKQDTSVSELGDETIIKINNKLEISA